MDVVLRDQRVVFALRAVREASLLVRQIQAEMVTPALTKDDRSPVTVADFAAQALVACRLSQVFPGERLVAEESVAALCAASGRGPLERVAHFVDQRVPGVTPEQVCRWIDLGTAPPSEVFWTLDPVDGTKGFLRGGQYAVALARIEHGRVVLGVLGCPQLSLEGLPGLAGPGLVIFAVRGHGCWALGLDDGGSSARLRVSGHHEPAEARLLRSYEAGHTNGDQIEQLMADLGIRARPIRMDSQAKFAVLAGGQGEVLLRLLSPTRPEYREKIWDQAAGSLVVEEAGGRVTDVDGRRLDFSAGRTLARNTGVVATNGPLHKPVLAALRRILAQCGPEL